MDDDDDDDDDEEEEEGGGGGHVLSMHRWFLMCWIECSSVVVAHTWDLNYRSTSKRWFGLIDRDSSQLLQT